MTTVFPIEEECAICKTKSSSQMVGSMTVFGYRDLDMRLDSFMYPKLSNFVRRCPSCGYCGFYIDKVEPETRDLVFSKKYKEQLNNFERPELANSFICKALIEENLGDYLHALSSAKNAAWVCDDLDEYNAAKKCRLRAVYIINKAEKEGLLDQISDQDGYSVYMKVELLRRAGLFDEAKGVIEKRKSEIKDEVILTVLEFQEELINSKDESNHKFSEVTELKEVKESEK